MHPATFSWALDALKNGNRVARSGWNGKGMHLFFVPGRRTQPAPELCMKMSGHSAATAVFPNDQVNWLPFIMMRTAQGDFVPWLPSQTDVLADDWDLVE